MCFISSRRLLCCITEKKGTNVNWWRRETNISEHALAVFLHSKGIPLRHMAIFYERALEEEANLDKLYATAVKVCNFKNVFVRKTFNRIC